MEYAYIKALHIIFVITWFSGLFYMGRLLIYNREAADKPEPERGILLPQLLLMSRRLLFAITWPSAVLTWIFGVWLVHLYPGWPVWLLIKIGLVVLLSLYHLSLHYLYKSQSKEHFAFSGFGLRIWNEVPTVFLIAIVMLVVVKQNISLLYGLGGLLLLMLILLLAIRLYKYIREKS